MTMLYKSLLLGILICLLCGLILINRPVCQPVYQPPIEEVMTQNCYEQVLPPYVLNLDKLDTFFITYAQHGQGMKIDVVCVNGGIDIKCPYTVDTSGNIRINWFEKFTGKVYIMQRLKQIPYKDVYNGR